MKNHGIELKFEGLHALFAWLQINMYLRRLQKVYHHNEWRVGWFTVWFHFCINIFLSSCADEQVTSKLIFAADIHYNKDARYGVSNSKHIVILVL